MGGGFCSRIRLPRASHPCEQAPQPKNGVETPVSACRADETMVLAGTSLREFHVKSTMIPIYSTSDFEATSHHTLASCEDLGLRSAQCDLPRCISAAA